MTDVRFAYDTDETALRGAVRDLLGATSTPDVLSTTYDLDLSVSERIWKALRYELGLSGLLVEGAHEEAADRALGFAAVVAEELGRHATPAPFLTSSVLATSVANDLDDANLKAAIETGNTVALLTPWSSSYDDVGPVAVRGDDQTVTGLVSPVAGAMEADLLLVPATGAGGQLEIHVVDASGTGVERRQLSTLDMTRPLAAVTLSAAPSTRVGSGPAAAGALRRAVALATIVLTSEQVGVCEAVLNMTAVYLKTRRQFGREIGSFQALKHRVADLWVDLEGLRAVARFAALAEDETLTYRASLAAAYASDVAVELVEKCLQLHAGIAMTWEHPLHFFLKRAKANQIALGTAGRHRALLAGIVDLPAPAP